MEEPKQSKEVRRPAFWEQPAQPAATEKKVKKGPKAEKLSGPTIGRAAEPEPSSSRQPEQPPGQQQPKRPQGKGRPIRFAKKLNANTPFIERNVIPRVRETVPPTRNDRGQLIPLVPLVEPEPETEPVAPTGDGDDDKGKEKRRPPPLNLDGKPKAAVDNRLPISQPDRPPRPMRQADEDAITLHHVLTVVNEALRVEMKRHHDVHQALAQDIEGPLRVLGDLGRLVRLLFWSMEQHRKKVWRDKRAVIRAGQPDEPDEPASTPEPWRGALAVFSTPVRYFTLPPQDTSRDDLEDAQRSENDENRCADGERDDENDSQEDDDDALFSALEPGVARHGAADSRGNERDPVWQAIRRSDRRATRVVRASRAVKRDHGTVFNDESSSEPESVVELDDKTLMDYLSMPSPSLRPRLGEDSGSPDALNPHRHKTYDIQEQRKEEAAEDRKIRQEAREARRKARAEARARAGASNTDRQSQKEELREQAQEAATAAVKKQLADLEDERDAALQLAKAAVYERDVIDAEREDRTNEMDQMRTLLRELIDRDFPVDVEEEGEERVKEDAEKVKGEVQESKEEEEVKEGKEGAEEGKKVEGSKQEEEGSKHDLGARSEEVKDSNKESHSAEDEKPSQGPTEKEPLPEFPSVSDFMRRPSRRSSPQFNRPSAPSTPLPPLTPYPPAGNMTPTIPTIPPTPATPMASWDRERLVEEVQRILHATAPPPTPLSRQWIQQPPPPSPAPTHTSSSHPRARHATTYLIKRTRTPLGTGFFASILDVLLTILLMVAQQKENVKTVGRWIWFTFLVPAYLTMTNVALRLWNKRQSRSQRQPPSRSGLADIPEDEAIVGQPLAATPSTIASLHHREARETRMALALAYHRRIRRAHILFPRDALAELAVFSLVVFSGFLLASAIHERNLWLDANNTADAPAQYLQTFVLQYRHDTGSCSSMPSLGPGPYYFCTCVPTLFDPRIITGPLVYLWNVWHDHILDYLRLLSLIVT